jgi:hypothetical protein
VSGEDEARKHTVDFAQNATPREQGAIGAIVGHGLYAKRRRAGDDRSGVSCACHCGFQADGSLINNGEKSGSRFLCISFLPKGLVGLDKGDSPRRQEQTSGEIGGGIGKFSSYAFG